MRKIRVIPKLNKKRTTKADATNLIVKKVEAPTLLPSPRIISGLPLNIDEGALRICGMDEWQINS
jgi:hypothetical protein